MSPAKQRRWELVYNSLREAIDQGKLSPGSAIPYEHTLMAEHGVSRNTVRTALQRLEAQGIITESRGNLGRAVAEYRPLYWHLSRFEVGERRDDPDLGSDEWDADMREQGREPRQEVTVAKLPAPHFIATRLGVESRSWLVRRRRLRYADDVPISIADTWLPDWMAELPYTHGDEVMYPWLEERGITLPGGIIAALGFKQRDGDDYIYVRHARDEESRLLNINPATTPVGEHVRVGLEADTGRPLRVLASVFPGNRLCLRYQVKFRNE